MTWAFGSAAPTTTFAGRHSGQLPVLVEDTPQTRKGPRHGVIPESASTSRASDPLLSTAPDPPLRTVGGRAVTDPLLSRGRDPLLLSPTRRMSGASMGPRSDYEGAQPPAP